MYGTPKCNTTENLRNHGKANIILQECIHITSDRKRGTCSCTHTKRIQYFILIFEGL